MSKSKFKKDKAEKLRQDTKRRQYRKAYGAYKYVVIAQASCGCCNTEPMHFFTKESCNAKWSAAGLDCSATIVDDAGKEHKDIDTFYGHRHPKDEGVRGLNYLIDQLR